MTVEQQSGRSIIVVSLVVVVMLSLGFMVWDVVVNGVQPLMVHLPRLGLIIAMFIWLLRGSVIARWTLIAVLGVGGGSAISAMLTGIPGAVALGISGFIYTLLAVILAMSSSVSSFLTVAQSRR